MDLDSLCFPFSVIRLTPSSVPSLDTLRPRRVRRPDPVRVGEAAWRPALSASVREEPEDELEPELQG